MYEEGLRKQYRYSSVRGYLTIEQLWTLPLSADDGFSLDAVAIELNKKIKESSQESFVTAEEATDKTEVKKLELIKHIISVRCKERDLAKQYKEAAALRSKLMETLEKKRNNALEELTEEQILERINALNVNVPQ